MPPACGAIRCALDLAPSDRELCSQSTIPGLEELPDTRALLRMARAMVDLYCGSFHQVPKRIVLNVDDTFDAVHGGQQVRLFNAHDDEHGFQPIIVFVTLRWRRPVHHLRPWTGQASERQADQVPSSPSAARDSEP